MKRKLTFLISAICCILLLSTLSIYFFLNCRQNAMGQTSDGVFSFERSDNPFYADYELAGEWEFYPDKLIFSANSDGNVPGNIESANPLTSITTAFLLLRQKNMPKHLPLLCQTLMQIKYLFLRPTRSPGNASA